MIAVIAVIPESQKLPCFSVSMPVSRPEAPFRSGESQKSSDFLASASGPHPLPLPVRFPPYSSCDLYNRVYLPPLMLSPSSCRLTLPSRTPTLNLSLLLRISVRNGLPPDAIANANPQSGPPAPHLRPQWPDLKRSVSAYVHRVLPMLRTQKLLSKDGASVKFPKFAFL